MVMRRLLRLIVLAAVITGIVKLVRALLEEGAESPGGGQAAPSAPQHSQQRSSPPPEPSGTGAGSSEAGSESPAEPRGRDNSTAEPSKAELYQRAKELDIEGRSKMSKSELQRAVEQAERRGR